MCEGPRTVAFLPLLLLLAILNLASCSVIDATFSTIKTGYRVIKGTVKGTVWVVRGTYQFTKETTKLVYRIGKFTFGTGIRGRESLFSEPLQHIRPTFSDSLFKKPLSSFEFDVVVILIGQ